MPKNIFWWCLNRYYSMILIRCYYLVSTCLVGHPSFQQHSNTAFYKWSLLSHLLSYIFLCKPHMTFIRLHSYLGYRGYSLTIKRLKPTCSCSKRFVRSPSERHTFFVHFYHRISWLLKKLRRANIIAFNTNTE